jgi:hypothetical protein
MFFSAGIEISAVSHRTSVDLCMHIHRKVIMEAWKLDLPSFAAAAGSNSFNSNQPLQIPTTPVRLKVQYLISPLGPKFDP